MMMNESKAKGREEGCGKWLRKKGKSKDNTKQQLKVFESCLITTPKPIIFADKQKLCKMKQSKMGQFLVGKTSKMKKDDKSDKLNQITTSREKGKLPRKQVSPEDVKYDISEDLWGSDSDEDHTYQTEENTKQKTTQVEKERILNDMHLVCHKDENSLKRNCFCTKEQKHTGKQLSSLSSKRAKKSKDNMDADIGEKNNSKTHAFTEWFENELDALIQHNSDKNGLTKETLLSISCRYPSSFAAFSDSEEELPQFSEWFNQQIEQINHRELLNNTFQSPARDCSQHDSTFTQWLEDNLENIKCPI